MPTKSVGPFSPHPINSSLIPCRKFGILGCLTSCLSHHKSSTTQCYQCAVLAFMYCAVMRTIFGFCKGSLAFFDFQLPRGLLCACPQGRWSNVLLILIRGGRHSVSDPSQTRRQVQCRGRRIKLGTSAVWNAGQPLGHSTSCGSSWFRVSQCWVGTHPLGPMYTWGSGHSHQPIHFH